MLSFRENGSREDFPEIARISLSFSNFCQAVVLGSLAESNHSSIVVGMIRAK